MKKTKRIPHKWTEEQEQFLIDNIKGISRKDLHMNFNKHFNLELVFHQVKARCDKLKLKNGLNGRFVKGQEPMNKGKTWDEYMSPEAQKLASKTFFKKGSVPVNKKPIGSIRLDKRDMHLWVKVSDDPFWPNRWKPLHRIVWEQENRPIPDNHRIMAIDGDLSNVELSNLKLMPGRAAGYMAKMKMFEDDPDLNELSMNIALVETTIHELQRKDKPNKT